MKLTPFDPESPEALNAYVDRELPPEQAAVVAELIAIRPNIAATVAALSKSRVVLADQLMSEADELTPLIELQAPRVRAWHAAGLVKVAAALLVALLGFGGWQWTTTLPSSNWQQMAASYHADWQPATNGGTLKSVYGPPAILLKASLASGLAAAKLSLVHRAVHEMEDGGWLGVMGYKGTRGCRITLMISDRDRFEVEGNQSEIFVTSSGMQVQRWHTRGYWVLLANKGMPENRFAVIGAAMKKMTETWTRPDDKTLMALRQSRETSQPCLT